MLYEGGIYKMGRIKRSDLVSLHRINQLFDHTSNTLAKF